MVKVNGKEMDLAGRTVSEVLAILEYDTKRVAVERNLDIVRKCDYDTAVLLDGDTVEIVGFTGGG
ncbi:MAG: sulfur carrier protein ThiS [Saccharofermentans sp.]|nr:sulfur carrier protein ThiS [Saccharofermentans sp.]